MMAHLYSFRDSIKSGLIGLAVGDALGLPVEFKSRSYLKENPVTDMIGYGTFNMPEGTWSDDTSMTLAEILSITNCRRIEWCDIMDNFQRWLFDGDFTPEGKSFDVGNGCRSAIETFHNTHAKPISCGSRNINNNGNGSLMRMLPFALLCHDFNVGDEQTAVMIHDASSLTHGHEYSVLGCLIYTHLLSYLLAGNSPADALYSLKQCENYSRFSPRARNEYASIIYGGLARKSEDEIRGSGYVVKSLEAAVWCLLKTDSYRDAVLKAANLGEDTDTTAAITGSMAGIVYGYDAIPQDWVKTLARSKWLHRVCEDFADAHDELEIP